MLRRIAAALLAAWLLGMLACQPLDSFRRAVTGFQTTRIAPSLLTPPP